MNKILAAGALAFLLPWSGGTATAQEDAAPEPWSLTFQAQPLEAITVPYKDGSARTVYVMTFAIENGSDATADLALHFTARVGTDPRKMRLHYAVPDPDAEEFVRRMTRTPGMMSVADINRHNAGETGTGSLDPGEKLTGVAVFGPFDREWDRAVVTVAGLEPRALEARVRKYGDAGFTLMHRAYKRHNDRVRREAGENAGHTDAHAIVKHNVVWRMVFTRKGDEFAAHLDPITLDRAEWDVVADPGPEIVFERFE